MRRRSRGRCHLRLLDPDLLDEDERSRSFADSGEQGAPSEVRDRTRLVWEADDERDHGVTGRGNVEEIGAVDDGVAAVADLGGAPKGIRGLEP